MEFEQKLDSLGKIYLPKPLRNAGFSVKVKIRPNQCAAIMYPSNVDLKHVKRSVEILLDDIEHVIESEVRFQKQKIRDEVSDDD